MELYSCEAFSLELLREKFENCPGNLRENSGNLVSQKYDQPGLGIFKQFGSFCEKRGSADRIIRGLLL